MTHCIVNDTCRSFCSAYAEFEEALFCANYPSRQFAVHGKLTLLNMVHYLLMHESQQLARSFEKIHFFCSW
jgi:hypothetical protein